MSDVNALHRDYHRALSNYAKLEKMYDTLLIENQELRETLDASEEAANALRQCAFPNQWLFEVVMRFCNKIAAYGTKKRRKGDRRG